MNRHNKILYLLLIVLILSPYSCKSRDTNYYKFKTIKHSGWLKTEPIRFDIDTLVGNIQNSYEMELKVRHFNNFPYKNLYLTVDLIESDGKVYRQTIDCPISDDYGNWYGSGFGSLYTVNVEGKANATISKLKCINIWHAMSDSCLVGVADVGVKIISK